ncbi:MAG TPA: hypothetical protein VN442_14225 [Bryobacteraceae bacterium]|nr:hypothetical protein [Bryobacteraceae bacterium]
MPDPARLTTSAACPQRPYWDHAYPSLYLFGAGPVGFMFWPASGIYREGK